MPSSASAAVDPQFPYSVAENNRHAPKEENTADSGPVVCNGGSPGTTLVRSMNNHYVRCCGWEELCIGALGGEAGV